MCIFVCNLIFLLFVYKASVCVNNTLAACVLLGPGIISHITKDKVLPCIQPALFHFPRESCNLFLPAHLPPKNPPVFSVPCSLIGFKVQKLGYKGNIKKDAVCINHSSEGME